ncbi:TPA: KilA-N domain-containing protein [Escherichia coli]
MMEITTTNTIFINTQDLLKMVNQARKESGEKAIRNNDFINRVKDELEGEGYEIFVTPMDKARGGSDQTVIAMSYKQALRVAARESKAVRRSLVDKLESMQLSSTPATPTSNPSLPGEEQIRMGIALLDGSRKLLHISDSSVLAGLRQLQRAAGLPDLLPAYAVDAPPDAIGGSSEPTASLRQLLTEHGVKLSSQKAYARLAEQGIVEQKTRTSTRGEKHYWCLTEKGLQYGKNLTSPGNPRQTQPHFYEGKFAELIQTMR